MSVDGARPSWGTVDRLTLEDARRDTAGSLGIQLRAEARLAVIRFAPETTLTARSWLRSKGIAA